MTSFDLERWKILSPHLDRALEMGVAELAAWLEALRREQPSIAADLERLLAERDAIGEQRFLEGSLVDAGVDDLIAVIERVRKRIVTGT